MTLPKLHHIEMLVAVIDNGGFGAAAAQLGATQSGVSYAVGELERQLGERLLVRARSGCTPTAAGARILPKARQMLELAAGLAEDARGDTQALSGHVRIACFRSVATHLLPNALETLGTRHPQLRIDVDDSYEERAEVEQALREGRADLAVAQLPVGPDLVQRPFVSDSYVLVLPAGCRVQAGAGWAQFAALPYIQLNCSGALAVLERCRAAGFEARAARTLATDSGICALVARGLGYSILPRLAVFPEPSGVQVVDLPVEARRSFVLGATPAMARDRAVRAVMATLRERRILERNEAVRRALVSW
ncbi:LysR family transcriptional regulator [Pseudoduganella sp. GCM10020061]|uniref:LysR family transcriptional regulator n=1 Tax=Pseudoduganella sp. GCM10020061 TaxID=3317345 RepID=UPI00363FE6E0